MKHIPIPDREKTITALSQACEKAVSYLRVCRLSNHTGSQIKVDQAINILKQAIAEAMEG